MKLISISTKLPFRVPKNFWNNIKTVQKTVGLSAILVSDSTLLLWSPKKLKSLPSLIRMSQRHIGLVMDHQSLPWKNTIKLIEEQKSFCTSIRIRKSFWKNRKFAACSRNTTSLCPFRSNWAPKKSPKQRGKAKMSRKSKKSLMISSTILHPHGLKNRQISKMKTIIVFIGNSIRCNLKIPYFKFISMLTIPFISQGFSIFQKLLRISMCKRIESSFIKTRCLSQIMSKELFLSFSPCFAVLSIRPIFR